MAWLTRISLKRTAVVVLATILLSLLGGYAATRLNVELLPDIETPVLSVVTIYPGASPDDVETAITVPVEGLLSGTSGLSVRMRRNTAAWDESTVTWNNAPASSSTSYSTRSVAVPGWTSFYMTSLVRQWVRGELEDFGVRLASLGLDGEMIDVASSNNSNAALRPELSVTYVPATRLGVSDLWTYSSYDHGGGNTSAVNVSTGNLVFTHSGGAVAARGFAVDLTSVYNSQDTYGQDAYYDSAGAWYGDGWTFSQNHRLYELENGGAVVYKDPSGGADRVYTKNTEASATEQYHRPLYYGMSLTKDTSATADPKKIYALKPDAGGQALYFDGGGKLRRIEDRNGNYLTYAYSTDAASVADPDGKLTTITDVAGRRTLFEYAGAGGRMSRITDMAGRVHTYEYSEYGNLKKINHWLSSTQALSTEIGYNIGHQLSSVTNPRGHVSVRYHYYKYGWDAAGSTDGWAAEANTTVSQTAERAFSGSGSLKLSLAGVTSTAAGGASRAFATPVSWNRTEQELTAVVWVPAGYALDARLVLTDSRGNVQTGPLTRVDGGAWTGVRLPSAHVDPAHKISKAEVRFTAPSGAAAYTGAVYVDHLMVRGITAWFEDRTPAHNTVLSHSYDWDNARTTVKQPNTSGVFQDTTYTYDNYGQTTRVEEPGAHSASTATYDADLRLQSATSEGATTDPEYYADSNEVRTVSSTGAGTTTSGMDTATGDPQYTLDERNTRRRADGLDFVATVYATDANGNVTSVAVKRYGANANLDSATVRACVTTGTPTATCGVVLRETRYGYGAGGLMTSMTDPNGNTTTFGYQTATGYMTRIETPAGTGEASGRVTTIAVNADGGPSRRTDPKGQVTEYAYDGLGRETEVRYGVVNGVAQSSVVRVLDAHGNPTRVTDAAGVTTYQYDANDQPTSEARTQNGVTKTATYAYHANGQMQSMAPMGGGTITYGYDAAGELVSQTDPNDGGRAVLFGHDHDARTATVTFPSGVSRRESYDVAGRITGITLKNAAGSVLRSHAYDYGLDAQGNPTAQYREGYTLTTTEQDGSAVSYGYDDLGRLVSAQRTGTHPYTQSISYDPNDNRLSVTTNGVTTTASYDAANQLVSQGSVSYAYDRNGNLTGYSGNSLSYDARNNWTGGTVNGKSVGFGYDGTGRRVSRSVDGARTDYWYDATGMSLETGAASTEYLRGPGGELLSRSRGTYLANYGTDRLGNVTALVSGESVVQSYAYDPWGVEIASSGVWYNPYRYTGTYQDEATGLYQMGARYYQPGTGRFTQLDPLACTISTGQRYGYAGGNPVNYTDPSGLWHARGKHWHYQMYRRNVWYENPYQGRTYYACVGACLAVGWLPLYRMIGFLRARGFMSASAASASNNFGPWIFGAIGGYDCMNLCNGLLGRWHWTSYYYRVWYNGSYAYYWEYLGRRTF
jgi:RHS repeat-associated protein